MRKRCWEGGREGGQKRGERHQRMYIEKQIYRGRAAEEGLSESR